MVLDALRTLEISTPNSSGFPIIEVPLANHEDIDEVGRFLFDRGIYTTIATYPLVPKTEVGFRVQITAANEDTQIERLVDTLAELSTRFRLQTAYTMTRWWEGAASASGQQ
jgi:8-amino-7-oxononanoate synthase